MEEELNSIVAVLGASHFQLAAPSIKRENVLLGAQLQIDEAATTQKRIDEVLASHGYTRKTRSTFESAGENWIYCHESKPHRSAIWSISKSEKTAYLGLRATGFNRQYAFCGAAKPFSTQE
ncbi:MAG: hypothetical protein J0L97_03915 [Alphaproteobacteria bacterium]|nr:hypothetical protein [Alphaproteobacteria bacterium]